MINMIDKYYINTIIRCVSTNCESIIHATEDIHKYVKNMFIRGILIGIVIGSIFTAILTNILIQWLSN